MEFLRAPLQFPFNRCSITGSSEVASTLTRVNSANVLDEGLRIGGRAMTRDFEI
jgi:hypothetical protein